MKYFINTIRIFIGLFFLFSGFTKAIDPLGLSFKLEEYFEESVLNLPFLIDFTLPISLFVIGLEIFLGIVLLIGTKKKWVFLLLLGLILFFSFLTFYSAYFNKVTDCGCFGDALKLTPWESFYKNMVLLFMILIVFIGKKYIIIPFSKISSNFTIITTLCIYIFVAYYGLFHLPLIDFRAYKEGTNIINGMKSAKELGLPEPKTQLIYTLKEKQTQQEMQVSDEEYINKGWWEKTNWEIDTTKTQQKLLDKGYEPPIKDFIINCQGKEITQEVLREEKLVLITSYKPDAISKKALQVATNLIKELEKEKIRVIFVSPKKIKNIETCTMDETVIKTMIRANPGVILLNKATILKEYHWNDVPQIKEISNILEKKSQ